MLFRGLIDTCLDLTAPQYLWKRAPVRWHVFGV